MQRLHHHDSQVNVHAILERAGFQQIRGPRASCAFCEGSRKLTVAITDDGLWYCHRCHRGGNVRSLAKQQGVSIPPPRIRKADIPKARFRKWLSQKMTEMSREQYELTRQWRYALAALKFFPDMEEAWQALATYYHRQRYFQVFWESAGDNIGRYWLYRNWRRHAQ